MSKRKANAAIFYAFDLLWPDGEDLRKAPLLERKGRLFRLVNASACSRLLYAQHIEQCGKEFFAQICATDLEGIVAKRKLGIYKDDGNSWIKIKNRNYSQAEGPARIAHVPQAWQEVSFPTATAWANPLAPK